MDASAASLAGRKSTLHMVRTAMGAGYRLKAVVVRIMLSEDVHTKVDVRTQVIIL